MELNWKAAKANNKMRSIKCIPDVCADEIIGTSQCHRILSNCSSERIAAIFGNAPRKTLNVVRWWMNSRSAELSGSRMAK